MDRVRAQLNLGVVAAATMLLLVGCTTAEEKANWEDLDKRLANIERQQAELAQQVTQAIAPTAGEKANREDLDKRLANIERQQAELAQQVTQAIAPTAGEKANREDLDKRLANIERQQAELAQQVTQAIAPTGQQDRASRNICGRSILMQEELLDVFSTKFCQAVTVEELYRLESLSLEIDSERYLEAADFDGMGNLVALDLRGETSAPVDLPSNLFRFLGSLRYLQLDGYTLDSVLALDFAAVLPNLEAFSLRVPEMPHTFHELRFSFGNVCLEHRHDNTPEASRPFTASMPSSQQPEGCRSVEGCHLEQLPGVLAMCGLGGQGMAKIVYNAPNLPR